MLIKSVLLNISLKSFSKILSLIVQSRLPIHIKNKYIFSNYLLAINWSIINLAGKVLREKWLKSSLSSSGDLFFVVLLIRDLTATCCIWCCKITMARPVLWCFVPGEGRRSHTIFVSRVHELFGGQRRAACTLSFLYPTVGWFEPGPRYHVQLRYLRCHALLQRATQGKSRIRDRSIRSNLDPSTHECWYIAAYDDTLSYSVPRNFKIFGSIILCFIRKIIKLKLRIEFANIFIFLDLILMQTRLYWNLLLNLFRILFIHHSKAVNLTNLFIR